ncbi:hypothetical protein CKO42_16355 [Lamprobacter modestohalophilus]|uniref:Uncharacterized protein n=1 Tax=Lamprobacter modestohalophilus TaxID=1064514 RepID=A0A9X0WBN6_9GAMM|nr:hypothetical protein [Lamprobacter modestohalophilus]MBK1619983.1 hypothetical protein [Lamprobacter modestohalophilus]
MSTKSAVAKLDKTRSAILAAQEALASLPDRPLPHDEAIARAHDLVDSQARDFQGAYRASAFVQPRITEAARNFLNVATVTSQGPQGAALTAGLLAWLHGDAIKAKLKAEIEAMELADALPLTQREPERQRLQAQIEALEIEEERLLRELEAAGEQVERRADASIEIILAPDAELSGEPMEKAA